MQEAPVRHYCTYFDSVYAPRGLMMIGSLLRHQPNAHIYVLCLDELCFAMLEALAPQIPCVTPIRLTTLEEHDPSLAACKSGRSKVEYYFTCTPCFPTFLFEKYSNIDALTYLDADLYFYQSPELIFDEIGDASIAITPHSFSPLHSHCVRYGIFNVAWITWRNDSAGRQCLADYRANCIDWCYDREEDGKFADQKYLDAWPGSYKGVKSLAHKGINLAMWNVENYTVHMASDVILVDELPLIFFHFHGVKHYGPGSFFVPLADCGVQRNAETLVQLLFQPYVNLLDLTCKQLSPDSSINFFVNQRNGQVTLPVQTEPGYAVIDRVEAEQLGQHDGWADTGVALRQEGAYAALLEQMRAGKPRVDFTAAAEAVKASGLDHPSLLEVGCGSGYYSEVFAHLVGTKVAYHGIDRSPAMVELARQLRPQGTYEVADGTALPYADGAFDIAFNGVSLMHIMDFEAAVAETRRVARKFCIFHTVPLLRERPTTFLKKSAYGGMLAEVIVNEAELRLLFARNGLEVKGVWPSIDYDLGPLLGEATPNKTFLCQVREKVDRPAPALLNIGSGGSSHPGWVNLGAEVKGPSTLQWNLGGALPFHPSTFDAVYSDSLDRLSPPDARAFVAECLRVLKPGATLRLAVPDFEQLCRAYLGSLEDAAASDNRHEALLAELAGHPGQSVYDRVSLVRLLREAGCENVTVTSAGRSSIPSFKRYGLDAGPETGQQSRTLFVEARRAPA